jgi:hypothetical protein
MLNRSATIHPVLQSLQPAELSTLANPDVAGEMTATVSENTHHCCFPQRVGPVSQNLTHAWNAATHSD